MSSIVQSFNPSTNTNTSFIVPQSAANGGLVFWNESNISLNIMLQNGNTFYLPAWYHKHLCGYTGNVNISWDIRTILSSTSPPLSEVIVEAYTAGESFPADGPLVRQTNLGNVVTTSQGSTLNITNDGNVAGTSIVEATVLGDSSSAVSVTNDAQMIFGTNAHPTLATFNGIIDVATINANGLTVSPNSTSLLITNITGNLTVSNGNITISNGTLQLDNGKGIFFKDTGGTYRQILAASNTDKTLLASAGGNFEFRDVSGNLLYSLSYTGSTILINSTSLTIQTSSGQARLTGSSANTHLEASGSVTLRIAGVDVLISNATGITLNQPLNFNQAGALQGITQYSGTTVANTIVNAAHGMGTTPDVCVTTIESSTSTTTYSTTWDGTNAKVLAAVGSLAFRGVAFKF